MIFNSFVFCLFLNTYLLSLRRRQDLWDRQRAGGRHPRPAHATLYHDLQLVRLDDAFQRDQRSQDPWAAQRLLGPPEESHLRGDLGRHHDFTSE